MNPYLCNSATRKKPITTQDPLLLTAHTPIKTALLKQGRNLKRQLSYTPEDPVMHLAVSMSQNGSTAYR